MIRAQIRHTRPKHLARHALLTRLCFFAEVSACSLTPIFACSRRLSRAAPLPTPPPATSLSAVGSPSGADPGCPAPPTPTPRVPLPPFRNHLLSLSHPPFPIAPKRSSPPYRRETKQTRSGPPRDPLPPPSRDLIHPPAARPGRSGQCCGDPVSAVAAADRGEVRSARSARSPRFYAYFAAVFR